MTWNEKKDDKPKPTWCSWCGARNLGLLCARGPACGIERDNHQVLMERIREGSA